jgi:hypothetical protein
VGLSLPGGDKHRAYLGRSGIMRVIAIDPGVTSGYTFALVGEKLTAFYPFQMKDDVDDMWHRLERYGPSHIVMENFEFRQRAGTGLDLFPVQLIGVARLFTKYRDKGCQIHLQSAHQGKGYYSDKVLKSRGLHKRGIPHGTDASRHLLHWLTFGYGYQLCPSGNFSMLDKWNNT